jgi:hypothetical protein
VTKGHDYAKLIARAEKAVAAVTDPELKRIAFQKAMDDLLSSSGAARATLLDSASKLIQVLSVVIGVLISVLSFNAAKEAEAHARVVEAEARKLEVQKYEDQRQNEVEARKLEAKKYEDQRRDEADRKQTEAAKPFLELRQKLYLEAVQAGGVLANPKDHSDIEIKAARTRFRQLYVAELSLVEGAGVMEAMVGLARAVAPELTTFTKEQDAAYALAHALRDSLVKSWGLNQTLVDNPSP